MSHSSSSDVCPGHQQHHVRVALTALTPDFNANTAGSSPVDTCFCIFLVMYRKHQFLYFTFF